MQLRTFILVLVLYLSSFRWDTSNFNLIETQTESVFLARCASLLVLENHCFDSLLLVSLSSRLSSPLHSSVLSLGGEGVKESVHLSVCSPLCAAVHTGRATTEGRCVCVSCTDMCVCVCVKEAIAFSRHSLRNEYSAFVHDAESRDLIPN